MGTNIHIDVFDMMLYLVVSGVEKNILYVIQFLIIGTFCIHKSKWTGSRPCCHCSIAELKHYGTLTQDLENKEAKKIFQYFQWV